MTTTRQNSSRLVARNSSSKSLPRRTSSSTSQSAAAPSTTLQSALVVETTLSRKDKKPHAPSSTTAWWWSVRNVVGLLCIAFSCILILLPSRLNLEISAVSGAAAVGLAHSWKHHPGQQQQQQQHVLGRREASLRHGEKVAGGGAADEMERKESTTLTGKRVAIVVAGTLQRYMFQSTLDHLIQPLVKQGHQVDYYLALTTAFAKAYRSDSGYMDRVHWDPIFTNGVAVEQSPDVGHVEQVLRQQLQASGAGVGELILRDHIDIDSNELVVAYRKKALERHPDEDPDLRFPLLDLRNDSIKQRTANANRNLLRLHLAVNELWQGVLQTEQRGNFQYDYVMFLRDDSLWLEDFDLSRILETYPDGDMYVPSCDARDPPLQPSEMNDHGIVAARKIANLFGDYISEMYKVDLEECQRNLPEELQGKGKLRGCNSEMLLKNIVESHGLHVKFVGQAEMPFQRSVHVVTNDKMVTQCYHKFCQSHDNRLEIADDASFLMRCKEMTFDS